MKLLNHFLKAVAEVSRFNALTLEQREYVFYAEDEGSHVHFSEMLRSLTEAHGKTVCYLTSSLTDPLLTSPPKGILPFYIGHGMVRTYLFQTLRAGMLVMTMPDLETFHLKRSRYHAVKYVYVFHSLVSTHVIYRESAFDHFDAILCSGEHHVTEIKKREALFSLPPKQLLPLGYGRLDSLRRQDPIASGGSGLLRVAVAPSWGPNGLLENNAEELINHLLAAGFHVTLRPHPRTWQTHRPVLEKVIEQHAANSFFALDTEKQSDLTFRLADVLLSDWSGAAFEFAFAYEKPVLFIDVPQKVNNPNFTKLGIDPVEKSLRGSLGAILPVTELAGIGEAITALQKNAGDFQKRIQRARHQTVYNLGTSGKAGAQHLIDLSVNSVAQQLKRSHTDAK